jgi:hypothetical protein
VANIATGQVTVTASQQALTASPVGAKAFTIKASSANANPVFVGAPGVTTGSGFRLDPGDEIDYQRDDRNGQTRFQAQLTDFFVIGSAASDVVSWLASL